MKFLLSLTLIFCTANGFSFSNFFGQNEEISSLAADCSGKPDGTKIPDETNCQKFTLCDGGFGLLLSCRSSDPYFYRCNSSCVNDISFCQAPNCPGESTTVSTTSTTSESTTSGSTTTPSTTTASVNSNTTTAATTTPFVPPTVPVSLCKPSCTSANKPSTCSCLDQWVCKDTTCTCDDTIRCPTDKATCIGAAPTGCGCEEACSCTMNAGVEECRCKAGITCPFPEADCETKCNCTQNCDCTAGICKCFEQPRQCPFDPTECMSRCGCNTNCDKVSVTPKAVCFEPCKCQDDYLCPFASTECVTKCKCEDRCITTGNLTRCDPDITCPTTRREILEGFWHLN